MSEALVTTVVGSYPQPPWLIDRERLGERLPPRVRAQELWRVEEPFLEEAQDDATRLAVSDMERAGIDVITDGEMRRESYSNRFATALEGVDLDEPGVALDRTGHENPVPRVVGPIRRRAGGGARRRVPALAHGAPDQDHRAGPVHDDAAGPERPLPGRPQPRARLRGGGQRGAARPEGGGRGRRPDRRAVPPGPARASPASTRSRRSTARSRHRGRDRPAHVLRVRAHRPRAARRLPVPPRAERVRRRTSRSRPRSPASIEVLRDLSDKVVVLGVLDLGSTGGRDARDRRRADPASVWACCRQSGSSSRPTAG